jgi:hypothetical protein
MNRPHTETEEALEDTYGVDASLPDALRADQLADGTFRYALENAQTGLVLAEGVHADSAEALSRFRQNLERSGLSPDEIQALQQATRQYERPAG